MNFYKKFHITILMAAKELCFLCFETLENKLRHTSNDKVFRYVTSKYVSPKSYPMFVTWKNDGTLRGCKGSFKDLPLIDGLKDRTIDAAFNDGRFHHLEEKELCSSLTCSISLLHSFEKTSNPLDWEIGVHGIRLFLDGNSSTYLPHVALEHKWDKMEALAHLARKGGYGKKYDEGAIKRSIVERYQASRESATWDEYQEFVKNLQ